MKLLEKTDHQEHCKPRKNIYCCSDILIHGNRVEVTGLNCEAAEGYEHNEWPEEEEEEETKNSEREQHHAGEHQSHQKASHRKAKVRV